MNESNDSTPIVARIQFSGFVAVATGVLAICIANGLGENVLRNLVLASVMCVFVVGGGLFGLIAAQHATYTHLPEGMKEEDERNKLTEEERRAEQEMRRSKGFLGLFTLPREDGSDGRDPRRPRPRYRDSA